MSVIDTRDLIAELADLRIDDWRAADIDTVPDDEDRERARVIIECLSECAGVGGDTPENGLFLVADRYFEDYARQLADDIGAVDADAGWPHAFIDWQAAADALCRDYTAVDFDGETYWTR